MKKLFFVAVVAMVAAACGTKNAGEWTLEGRIKGLGDGVASLHIGDDIMRPISEIILNFKDDRVKYRGTVERPMVGHMLYANESGGYDMLGAFVVEPGAHLKLDGDLSWPRSAKGYVGGNRTNDRLSAFWKEIDTMGEGDMTIEQMEELERKSFEFVGDNTDNFGGVFMLSQMSTTGSGNIVPTEEVMELYSQFTPEMRDWFGELETLLYGKGYFSFKEDSRDYARKLFRTIRDTLPGRVHRPAPRRFDPEGEGVWYATFRRSRATTWYVFFTKYNDGGEIVYLVQRIENNHIAAQYM